MASLNIVVLRLVPYLFLLLNFDHDLSFSQDEACTLQILLFSCDLNWNQSQITLNIPCLSPPLKPKSILPLSHSASDVTPKQKELRSLKNFAP